MVIENEDRVKHCPRHEVMDVFDDLPEPVRRAMARSTRNWCDGCVRELVALHGASQTVTIIANNELAEFMALVQAGYPHSARVRYV